jgi:ribonuclease HII
MEQPDLFAVALPDTLVAGVDEAGRGPLAGPVFAAAVILAPGVAIEGLADSKKLSERRRDQLAPLIKARALSWHIAQASVREIDSMNILQATMLAMNRACRGLEPAPLHALIDGNRIPASLPCTARAVIKGDATVAAISAASILAKTARDAYCRLMHQQYPDYGFDRHKGYGTALHIERLNAFGPCPLHRRSFAPVSRLLGKNP